MEKIEEIVKIFQPTEAGKSSVVSASTLSTAEKKRLISMARQKNIKLPKKGF